MTTSLRNKMDVNWIGPGKVLNKISETNYVVDLPGKGDTSYHVNLMKPYHWRPESVNLEIEEVSEDIERDEEIPYPLKRSTTFDYEEICKEGHLLDKLSTDQIKELKNVIIKNKDVFSSDPGTTHLMKMDID
ncbi:retrovirus-related Pol polyprotein from transposon 297 [Trichonephila clavipes]|nr:retrovirus-related Pol polyprotein from transposon 297 [Trichonephila clavipes]